MFERFWSLLTSTRFALALFGVLSVLALLGTLPGLEVVYHHPVFRTLVGLLGFSTLACTLQKRKSLKWHVLVIHSGVVITLIGGMVSWLGYVATVNAYEGDKIDTFFRWDIEKDVPLGFSMIIKRINTDFYPVPVKVGIMHGTEKKELFILKTGESFQLGQFRVRADRLEPKSEKLSLTVFRNGEKIGSADTDGVAALPPDFPYSFKLVAYQEPVLKRMWVDLSLSSNGRTLAEGSSEVNAPMHWNGLSFFHTQVAFDPSGRQYAGIQIVKDPGMPLVFAGMIVTSLGGLFAFARRKVWH
ncbi:resB-like family protein [Geobacter sp. OR-1]|uniref:hypothetical protein n=1 Tax=Geobacter sp. OR-1 TaxID=1266765 RepID=UPI0005424408|nr:hypothetical protein [Geobacter sp. OR-1]GAM11307.1 resB-like family protein [Geobacter sp. OR-1]